MDKNTIINQLVSQVSDILESKVADLRLTAEISESAGKPWQAASYLAEIPEIEAAINTLRSREGSWA